MERLNLTEPVERQWVCDKAWTTPFDSPNQMYSFYASFLAYLEMIRNMGKDHWRTLECHEGNPNSVMQICNYPNSSVFNNENNRAETSQLSA